MPSNCTRFASGATAPGPASGMRPDLRPRLFGGVLAALLAALVIFAGGWLLLAALPLLIWGLVREWTALTMPRPTLHDHLAHAAAPLQVVALFAFVHAMGWRVDGTAVTLALILAAAVAVLVFAFVRARVESLAFFSGAFYITLPTLAFLWLRSAGDGLERLIWLVCVVIATDCAAYFVGSAVGGAKLAPRISPGKTWSGLAGGAAGAAITGAALSPFIAFGAASAAILALALALIAQGGDLFESWLKRRAGVKDSGTLIPGHGGLLDRLDGYMPALPVLALVLATGGIS